MPEKSTIVFAGIIFALTLLCAFLLNSTGLSIAQLLDMQNLRATLAKFLSMEFILLLLITPLIYALAVIAMKKTESKETIAICSLAGAIATIIALIIFRNLSYYWIIAVFFIATIPVSMYYSAVILKELKKYVLFRGTNSAIHKGALLLLAGCLVFGAVVLLPQTKQLSVQFEYAMIESIIGANSANISGSGNNGIAETVADNMIQQQIQFLELTISNPLFQKLKEKTDPDVIAFVASTDLLKQQLQSPEYKQQVITQITRNTGTAQNSGLDNAQLLQIAKTQFPVMQLMEDWFWLITTLILITIIQLVFTIIIAPLGAAYSLIIDRLFPETAVQN
ncbi:MAG TPA: hypothetical protein VI977_02600 [archaeon]|nr:hypothetical protein [archaeon]